MALSSEIDQMNSVKVRRIHDWWRAARGPNGIPDRQDFDPATVKDLLPFLIVADVEPAPFRIRYRLVGTSVVNFTGMEFTGRYLDEFTPAKIAGAWADCYRAAFDSRRPFLGSETEPTTSGGTFTYEYGLFPIGRGGDAVEQFIAVEDYFGFELTSAQLQPWAR